MNQRENLHNDGINYSDTNRIIRMLLRFDENVLRFAQQVVRVDSGVTTTTLDSKLRWILKRHRVDIYNNSNFKILFRSVYHSEKDDDNTNKRLKELLLRMVRDAVNNELEWRLKKYRVNNNNNIDGSLNESLSWKVKKEHDNNNRLKELLLRTNGELDSIQREEFDD